MKLTTKGLCTAKQFASRSGVTVRTLHHYDRLGLLKPEGYTASGYRLYGEQSLALLQQISTLKFVGFPLNRIKEILSAKTLDVRSTLMMQREALQVRYRHLEMVMSAIDRAEALMKNGDTPDWESLKYIIEVIEMENNMEWIGKYYSTEDLEKLASHGTPETIEKGQRDWTELIAEVEASLSEDPASEKIQALAKRWSALIQQFTMGDPGISSGLQKVYADQKNWPANFKKPYSDEAASLMCKAIEIRNTNKEEN